MLGIEPSELMLIALVALVVIGPKDLPKAMRVIGYWVGRARGVARQFRQGFDNMVREAELEEMEKKWAAENARIMREHPATSQDERPQGIAAHDQGAHGGDVVPAATGDAATVAHDAGSEPIADDAGPVPVATPVFVDQPHVQPAPDEKPRPRGDGVTS